MGFFLLFSNPYFRAQKPLVWIFSNALFPKLDHGIINFLYSVVCPHTAAPPYALRGMLREHPPEELILLFVKLDRQPAIHALKVHPCFLLPDLFHQPEKDIALLGPAHALLEGHIRPFQQFLALKDMPLNFLIDRICLPWGDGDGGFYSPRPVPFLMELPYQKLHIPGNLCPFCLHSFHLRYLAFP